MLCRPESMSYAEKLSIHGLHFCVQISLFVIIYIAISLFHIKKNKPRYFSNESKQSGTRNVKEYGARNLEMSIRFSLKSRPSERFQRPEMSQIKAEISLRTNVKLIFHKNVGLQ